MEGYLLSGVYCKKDLEQFINIFSNNCLQFHLPLCILKSALGSTILMPYTGSNNNNGCTFLPWYKKYDCIALVRKRLLGQV
jgi:hypothetical protein